MNGEGTLDALRSRTASGRPSKLQGKDFQKIQLIVVGKAPRQLKFEFAQWTRAKIWF